MAERRKPYCESGSLIYCLKVYHWSKFPPIREGTIEREVYEISLIELYTNLDKAYKAAAEIVRLSLATEVSRDEDFEQGDVIVKRRKKFKLPTYQTISSRIKKGIFALRFQSMDEKANNPFYHFSQVMIIPKKVK